MTEQVRLDAFAREKNLGKIRKEEIEVQGFYDLPEGWKWVKLKRILKKDRQTINPQEYPDKDFFLVTMDCVESDTGKLLKIIKCRGKEIKSIKYKFNVNHILYGKLRPYLNKVYIPDREGICTTEFIPFIVTGAAREYVAFYLRRKEVVNFAMRHITGTRQPRVIIDALLDYPLPLSPLEEQKRIVARIEELVGRAEEARRLRRISREEAEKIMQAALHKVFSRAEEEGWKWLRLGELAYIRRETIDPQEYPDEEFELYSIPAYHQNERPEINSGKEIRSTKVLVQPNDCLYGKLNPHLPKVWLVEAFKGKRQIASTELFPLVPKVKDALLPSFLFLTLKTNYFKDRMVRKVIGTTKSRKRLSKNDVLEEFISLPPVDEQKRMIAYFDKIKETIETLEKLQQGTEEELEKLVPAILDKAFSGKL